MGDKKEAPPEGTEYEIVVHLFETGSAAEIAKGAVTVSARKLVDALREAIIHKGFSKLEGRKFDELVVKTTRSGAPLDPDTDLWEVEFERNAKGRRQAYVDVAPKTEEGPPGTQGDIPALAMRLYHQRDWQSHFIGPAKFWFCQATLTSPKTSLQIELTVDTGCSCELLLPKRVLTMLGVPSKGEGPVRATTANGQVVVERYQAVNVTIPLFAPPTSDTWAGYQERRDAVGRSEELDPFGQVSTGKDRKEEPFIDMFASEESENKVVGAAVMDVLAVPLQPLTRHHLHANGWIALLGLPGLQKLKLTLFPEMHVLLPIKLPIDRL